MYEEEISTLEKTLLSVTQEQFLKLRGLDASFKSGLEDIESEIVPLIDISLTLNGTLPSEKGEAKKIDLLVTEKTTHLSALLRAEEKEEQRIEYKKRTIEKKRRKIIRGLENEIEKTTRKMERTRERVTRMRLEAGLPPIPDRQDAPEYTP